MFPLCSAPLIALLVAGEDWSLFLVGTWRCCSSLEHVFLLGYHYISYLINASIYLVKGGRLSLLPSVLFHSCRPSFRHIGVMFLDFVFLLLVVLAWVDPGDEYVIVEPIEYAYKDQGNSENFAGKMTIPSKSLLCLLAWCLLFFYAYATIPTTCLSCLPKCHVKPLTHHVLANRWLAMLPLCSAPLIALLVAGEDWRSFLVGTCLLLGYHHIILFHINAPIYLVKGGRLGLMPGVLFHSCCPSFRHTGGMFLDFAFLTRLGYNGNPLIVRLD